MLGRTQAGEAALWVLVIGLFSCCEARWRKV
jgi:hypothetical protein